jgi:hypothetical protein
MVKIKLFMQKTPNFSVSHGSKPAYSFPMLIKGIKVNSFVHESLYIASFRQNINVFNENTYIQCSLWQQTCILITHDMGCNLMYNFLIWQHEVIKFRMWLKTL